MSESLQRGIMLASRKMFDQAERELRTALGQDPNDPLAHSFLALCLLERKALEEAFAEASRAVKLAADFPFAQYVLACALRDRKDEKRAEETINEAIRLDPEDADFFAFQGLLRFERRDWSGSLSAAEQGLSVDSGHVGCANLRARALINLGRNAEANDTLDDALTKDPENPWTHANRGWALLERGDRTGALEHFREALRLDPTLESARLGIVEALKSKHWIYRVMLRYFLWSAKLSQRAGIVLVLGVLLGPRVLRELSADLPALSPVFLAASLAIVAFALMTWIVDPLFNLLLRLNRFGRMALSREQIVASNYLGICVLGTLAALPVSWATGNRGLGFFMLFVFGFMMLPVSATFKVPRGMPRILMAGISVLLASLGLILIATTVQPLFTWQFVRTIGNGDPDQGARNLVRWFLTGVIGSTWISAGLSNIGR